MISPVKGLLKQSQVFLLRTPCFEKSTQSCFESIALGVPLKIPSRFCPLVSVRTSKTVYTLFVRRVVETARTGIPAHLPGQFIGIFDNICCLPTPANCPETYLMDASKTIDNQIYDITRKIRP